MMVAWLIERGQPEGFDPPVWWSLIRTLPESYTWTTDATKATRFATKEYCEAEIYRRSHPLAKPGGRYRPFGRATEHAFSEMVRP